MKTAQQPKQPSGQCSLAVGMMMMCIAVAAGCSSTPSTSTPASAPNAGQPQPSSRTTANTPSVILTNTTYRGWTNSYLLQNDKVEVIIVPRVGRVMQFGFRGEEGVFWENLDLQGKDLSCESKEWINFGGDKTWPAPEADWSRITGRARWHPPAAFDCLPLDARTDGTDVVLTSRVDPHYGVRTLRRVHLDAVRPEMTIETTYERIWGKPSPIAVWIITQLKEPLGVYVPCTGSALPKGFVLLTKEPAPTFEVENGLASLKRDPFSPYKVGFESSALLWVGEKHALRIDSLRVREAEYPDKGSSAEVYTNPDPLKYVELEMLSPLNELKAGDKIVQTNRYTLFRRTDDTIEQQARRMLAQ